MKEFIINVNKNIPDCDEGYFQRVTVLGSFKHFFTGETYYKIRTEDQRGWFDERYIKEDELELLKEKATYDFARY